MIPVIWIAAVGAAGFMLHRFQITPEPRLAATKTTDVSRINTLLLFAHPKCPCTTATLKNLELVHRAHPQIQTEIFLVIPSDAPQDFDQGPTAEWQATHTWAKLSTDEKGVLARSFGATASGHAIFLDSKGETRFSGGLTRSRGTAGDSTALRSLLAAIAGDPTPPNRHTDVFGCSLL